MIKTKNYESIISISDVGSYHPYRMKIFKNKKLVNFVPQDKENMLPRQTLPKIFIRSGSFYLSKTFVLNKYSSIVGKNCYGIELKNSETLNIDTKNDLKTFIDYEASLPKQK